MIGFTHHNIFGALEARIGTPVERARAWICVLFSMFSFVGRSGRFQMLFLKFSTDDPTDFRRVNWALATYEHFIRELCRSCRTPVYRDLPGIVGFRGVIEVWFLF